MENRKLNNYIDHTLLKPETTQDKIKRLCHEASTHGFYSVCVNPIHVSLCKQELKGTQVKICAVVGFPLGASRAEIKALEAKMAVEDGADEVDMVLNVGAIKDGRFEVAERDIASVVKSVRGVKQTALVKVIIETSLLEQEEKMKACQISERAGADFVKTSTGFSGGGATIEDVELMRRTVGPSMMIKASGGIKDVRQAWALIEAGANRLGTSSGVALIRGDVTAGGY